MGTMTFRLPSELPPDFDRELERCCVVGGPDNMPFPMRYTRRGEVVLLQRETEESGFVVAPWPIEGAGLLLGGSATLMERATPYDLLLELSRGKINQIRNQSADWQAGGLVVSDELRARFRAASAAFGDAVCGDPADIPAQCRAVLALGHAAGNDLVDAYVEQVFQIRHQRDERLDAHLSCRLDALVLRPDAGDHLRRSFDRVSLPLSWHTVEAEEATYHWGDFDPLLAWAEAQGLEVTAGPLIDFSAAQMPEWLWMWERDLHSMTTFMCRFVEAAVRRYRTRIRRWQFTAASNWARVLGLSESDLMSLTYRLCEAARGIDPSIELILGVSQPWGEYLVPAERTSPFIFTDNLIRSGLELSAINLEVVMGVTGRGSYCRDRLDLSRLLDLYALLGVPIQATLGYPSSAASDPDADPEMSVGAGHWRGGFTPQAQADWAADFVSLALCKPYVQAVNWIHFADAKPHQFPNCGLVDAAGRPMPALDVFEGLRAAHLG